MKSMILGLLAAGLLAGPMTASALVIGEENGANCLPFACNFGPAYEDYRQVYAATEFSGPVTISSIGFFESARIPGGDFLADATWTLSLSTTTSVVGGDLVNGADILSVYSGTSPTMIGGKGTFMLSHAFNYDPARGNLLLTVLRSGGQDFRAGFAADGRESNCSMSRSVRGGPATDTICVGLVTEFGTDVPEPGTFALLSLGLVGVGVSRRRKVA